MAGTNAVAYKRALINAIAAFPALATVQVAYSWPGKQPDMECVHGGRVEGQQNYATFAGGRARLPRDESVVIRIYVVVRMHDADDGYDIEQRLAELGQAIEDGIAGNPQITGVPGLLYAEITGLQMESYPDDDAWQGALEYQITVRSRLN